MSVFQLRHVAGLVVGGLQLCSRCGTFLIDQRWAAKIDGGPVRYWQPGQPVIVSGSVSVSSAGDNWGRDVPDCIRVLAEGTVVLPPGAA